jgi:hypothetical protein
VLIPIPDEAQNEEDLSYCVVSDITCGDSGVCKSSVGCSSCDKIAEAEAVVSVNEEVVSDACACVNAARRASGPPKPLAHCDMKVQYDM